MSDPLQRALAALIRQGASEEDLEAYTAEYEQAHRFKDPNLPAMTSTGEKVLPGAPRKASLGEQAVGAGETLLTAVNPFQDELSGGVAALMPGGQGYSEARDAARNRTKAFKRENPKTGLVLDIAGAVVPAAASGGASIAARGIGKAPLGQLMKAGAKAGAGAGAVYGFGSAEGDIEDQIKQTALSTFLGGAIGGAVPAVGRATGWAGRKTGAALGLTTKKGRAQRMAETLDEELAGSGQTVDDAINRADDLRTAGVENVTTAEALGPAGPRVVDKMRSGLNQARDDVTGIAPAGRAAKFGRQMDESVEEAKKGLAGRTGDKTHALYEEARKVGGIEITDPKAQRALSFFRDEFPEADDLVMDKLKRQIADGTLSMDDVIDPRSGRETLTYWDELKKFLDGQVHARNKSPVPAWPRGNAQEASRRLDDLVAGVDDAYNLKTGKSTYAEARAQAGKDIQAREALTEQQAPLARSLERASIRTGKSTDPETAFAQFGAGRGKIGLADVFMDVVKKGVRSTEQKQAETTLAALLREDPEILLRELAKHQVAGQRAAGRKVGRVGTFGGSFTGNRQ